MDDLISRQAAIDALKSLEFRQYMEFGEYVGEDTKEVCLIRAEKAQDALQSLPSAQPEIIRCRECKHMQRDEIFHQCWCNGNEVKFDDYCSHAERRQDG